MEKPLTIFSSPARFEGDRSFIHVSLAHFGGKRGPWERFEATLMYYMGDPKESAALIEFYHDLGHAINEALPGTIYPLPDKAEVAE